MDELDVLIAPTCSHTHTASSRFIPVPSCRSHSVAVSSPLRRSFHQGRLQMTRIASAARTKRRQIWEWERLFVDDDNRVMSQYGGSSACCPPENKRTSSCSRDRRPAQRESLASRPPGNIPIAVCIYVCTCTHKVCLDTRNMWS